MAEINNFDNAAKPSEESLSTDGDKEKYVQEASDFIENTSLDKMLEIAEEALSKKIMARATEPRKWVIPDELK